MNFTGIIVLKLFYTKSLVFIMERENGYVYTPQKHEKDYVNQNKCDLNIFWSTIFPILGPLNPNFTSVYRRRPKING